MVYLAVLQERSDIGQVLKSWEPSSCYHPSGMGSYPIKFLSGGRTMLLLDLAVLLGLDVAVGIGLWRFYAITLRNEGRRSVRMRRSQ
jgi:hypothetical protein